MHEERAIGNIDDLYTVDIPQRVDDLLVMRFAIRVDSDIADQVILSDTRDVDTFNVAACFSDGGRDLTQLAGFVLNLDA